MSFQDFENDDDEGPVIAMTDEELDEIKNNIEAWLLHTEVIYKYVCYIQIYFMLQLCIAITEFVLKWGNQLALGYVFCVVVQYIYHIRVYQAFKVTALQRRIQLSQLLQSDMRRQGAHDRYENISSEYHNLNSMMEVSSYIFDQNDRMNFSNKFIMLWMWILGNVIFLVSRYYDWWFQVAQVGLAWFIIGIMLSGVVIACILLPLIYCYVNYKEYRSRNRRRQIIHDVTTRAEPYRNVVNQSNQPCSICLEEYAPTDSVVLLCRNQHVFHVNCLEPWLERNEFCPVCRQPIR